VLGDPIKAAIITGSIQAISASATIFATWVAFRSWRRSTLGSRQIELAEECLLLLWGLDAAFKAARQHLVPIDIEEFEANARYNAFYKERHAKAWEGMKECKRLLDDLKNKFLIAEFYLGNFPHIRFSGETRFYKMSYPIVGEYDELVGQLCVCLFNTSPQAVLETLSNKASQAEIEKSANLFYGFIYEYEEDEYSVRLKITRRTFERYIRVRLRQTSMLAKAGDGGFNRSPQHG